MKPLLVGLALIVLAACGQTTATEHPPLTIGSEVYIPPPSSSPAAPPRDYSDDRGRAAATSTSSTGRAPSAADAPAASILGASSPSTEVYYANCAEARAAGRTDILAGEPGYRAGLDRDRDGIACEADPEEVALQPLAPPAPATTTTTVAVTTTTTRATTTAEVTTTIPSTTRATPTTTDPTTAPPPSESTTTLIVIEPPSTPPTLPPVGP